MASVSVCYGGPYGKNRKLYDQSSRSRTRRLRLQKRPLRRRCEHLGATFLRNHPEFADKTVYFGPMGCRTGFYMLLAGDYTSREIAPLVTDMFTFIRDFRDEIPGAAARDCGNYLDQNLPMANWLADRYLNGTLIDITDKHLVYPE